MFPAFKKNRQMSRFFVFLLLCLSGELVAEKLQAPGAVNCPALRVGPKAHTDHSCTSGPSVPGTVCSFDCSRGYKGNGPPEKRCDMDGSWTDEALTFSCVDVNECNITNGFCSHICKNLPGSYRCECPSPLYLDTSDQRTCKAHGAHLSCEPNHMKIVLPKNLIHNLTQEHLSLLDPTCKARSNATHYILSTNVTGCGTRSHVYKNFIVYTNRVLESPDDDTDVVTRVGKNEIKVPFSCYFNDLEIVHVVGLKPVAHKIHVYVKGRGNYALSLDIFKDKTYGGGPVAKALQPKYTQADFPITVQLRQRVYVQASLDTRETDLKIFLSNCCSTPMQDHEATMKFRHPLIVKGCPRDPSVQFHASSDPTKVRFSFEAFEFLGDHDYVFVHCRVHVCDVNDKNSRCAKGCINDNSSVVRDNPGKSRNLVAHTVKIPPLQTSRRKTLAEKPMSQSIGKNAKAKEAVPKKPVARNNKVHDHAKLPAQKNDAAPQRRVMKRATGRPIKKGVLATVDVSEGPFILDFNTGKENRRQNRPNMVSPHAKRSGIKQEVKAKTPHKRSSIMPTATNLLLVALTVASIMALIGVAYLGRKAMKTAKNPFNYQTLAVN